MKISNDTPVGQIAVEHPLATRVFARHGIDFCCGGGKPIAEVCRTKGLDTKAVLQELEEEMLGADVDLQRWDEAELDALIDHILVTYHRPLAEELPRLQLMAQKVFVVHGQRRPNMLGELLATFLGLKAELESQMMKEEQIVFPMIRQGRGSSTAGPVGVMEHEHESAEGALERLRELTNGLRSARRGVQHVEGPVARPGRPRGVPAQHIHLENNILFPRALAS